MNMSGDLVHRISRLDPRRPYVWQLRLSADDFDRLEDAVACGGTSPLENVVYLAEWYRRRYDGGTAKPVREFNCEKLFRDAGIDSSNLFETENGNKTWQYSLFVLGGVAIPFELGKTNTRFLKELCKIYYGEEGDVDKLGDKDKSRAVAFRESVRRRGSLYGFLQAVLSEDKPFAEEDLSDPNSQVNQFVERIKRANDEVLKSKFDLEWIVGFDPSAEYMTRRLRLVLKPESLGGLNHQYLKLERVRLWGVKRPETVTRLAIGIRFCQDDAIVAEPDFVKPVLDYSATGDSAAGFVAWGTDRKSRKIDAPVEAFNKVEIVARDNAGEEYLVDSFRQLAWLQLFKVPDGYNEWSSVQNNQHQSAVLLGGCGFLEDGIPSETYRKRFWIKGGAVSEPFLFREVVDKVTFLTDIGEVSLYNRQGYDQILAWPHRELLRYHNGCVNYTEEVDGELEESQIPLLFGREDLVVRHFETRNDLSEDAQGTQFDWEKLEFLKGGAYCEWTDEVKPSEGKVILRVTVKGAQRKFVAYYLPLTIERDCVNGAIVYDGKAEPDPVIRDGTPTDPVVHRSFGSDSAFVSLEIWRATKHKEIVRGSKVVGYVEDGETGTVSYGLKEGLVVHDFSVDGYREYACRDIGDIYKLPAFSPKNDSQLAAYENGTMVRVADELDEFAPKWLYVDLATKVKKTSAEKLVYWDYLPESPLKEVDDDSCCQGNDIVFHCLKGYEGMHVLSCRVPEPDPFSDSGDAVRGHLVECFERATANRGYYFVMQPFREANMNLKDELYTPLLAKRNGVLSEADRQGLFRLARELGFDWQLDYGVSFA